MKYAVTFSFKSWDKEKELITTDVCDNLDEVTDMLQSIDIADNYNLISVVSIKD